MRKQNSERERIFQKEDKVYLSIKNLNLKDEMKKLRHTAEGPFLVERNIKNVAYELRISGTKIHKTFNANSLTKADPAIPVARGLEVKNREKEYEVNKILGERKNKGRTEFLINWKGYSHEEDQWEPEQNVKNAKKAIKLFRNKALKGGVVLRTRG